MENRFRIVVIGGSHAGLGFIKSLKKKKLPIDLTLIDIKSFYEVNFVNLWELVTPSEVNSSNRINFASFFKDRFIQDKVENIKPDKVILKNEQEIEFDYLVIASGSSYSSLPLVKNQDSQSIEEITSIIKQESREISRRKNITIIGGGAVGVELIGEILSKYPSKKLNLVELGPRLIINYSKKASQAVYDYLTKKGVEIFLNETTKVVKVINGNTQLFLKNSERIINCDKIIKTFGLKPNSDFLKPYFHESLTQKGFIIVDQHFQVKNTHHIFAIGDITESGDNKLGLTAFNHANYLAKFLAAKIKFSYKNNRGKKFRYKTYKQKRFLSILPIGKKFGILQIGNFVLKTKLGTKFKHSNGFIKYVYGKVGLKK